ncbi:SigE family RNA polymerase sigma factor [Nocardioides daejeonensis]|uniref:SigE family RNA polymerase sigma factor n=1 Tax=Nocardioides daejeonensis TaxID=1046556 RepID=UPI001EF429AD|nr:SigE family RNA polymerase sigma factor [Nocardioides daejeonensis]
MEHEGTAPVDFDGWVAARGPALLRLARRLTADPADAEDVVQEALARALVRWERISRVEDVDAYVTRMVVNAHTSWWRRFRRREQPVPTPEEKGSGAGAADDTMAYDERDRLREAVRRLPAEQRVAVVLRYYEQREYAEIAALTGVREGTVRSRVSRGIAVLRREWGEQDG